MNRRVLPLIIGSLLLLLGCGGGDDPMDLDEPLVLQPTELCSGNPVTAIATFEDANLETEVRFGLNPFSPSLGQAIPFSGDLTCDTISGLTGLSAAFAEVESLAGTHNLTGLTTLNLGVNSINNISALSGLTGLTELLLYGNSIRKVGPLSGLTGLTELSLGNNSVTDISALMGLTSLTQFRLYGNSITDISILSVLTGLTELRLDGNPDLSNIQPLLDNTGLGAGTTVNLVGTNVSCTDVAALQAKGVEVENDWGSPTGLTCAP